MMKDIQKAIQEVLAQARGIRRKRMILAFVATLVVVIGLIAWADQALMFSGWMRWVGWLVGLPVAVWVARLAAGQLPRDASTLAHQVEKDAGENAAGVYALILEG